MEEIVSTLRLPTFRKMTCLMAEELIYVTENLYIPG